MATRITRNVQRQQAITVTVNGRTVAAHAGETLAAVLFASGINVFYNTASGRPRGPYCNMGTCFECRVRIDTDPTGQWRRACMTAAQDGMCISTGEGKSDV